MSGKIGPQQPKVTHGHTLPDHLNPAKHPDGKLRNDHEAGPSGTAHDKDSKTAEVHTPGQEAPLSLSAEANTPSLGMPEFSSSGAPSKNPSQIQREEGGESSRSNTSLSGFDEVLSLVGGGKFKNWNEYHKAQTFSKADRFEMELDRNAFVASHLNPDIQSPEHVKTNWTKRPGFDNPMLADYTIVQNPLYYAFRRPTQHSGPLALPSQSGAKADYQSDPRSTQSTPAGSPRKERSADSIGFRPVPIPDGSGSPVSSQSTNPPKENNPGTLSAGNKAALAGTAGLVAVGIITVTTANTENDASSASGEASA